MPLYNMIIINHSLIQLYTQILTKSYNFKQQTKMDNFDYLTLIVCYLRKSIYIIEILTMINSNIDQQLQTHHQQIYSHSKMSKYSSQPDRHYLESSFEKSTIKQSKNQQTFLSQLHCDVDLAKYFRIFDVAALMPSQYARREYNILHLVCHVTILSQCRINLLITGLPKRKFNVKISYTLLSVGCQMEENVGNRLIFISETGKQIKLTVYSNDVNKIREELVRNQCIFYIKQSQHQQKILAQASQKQYKNVKYMNRCTFNNQSCHVIGKQQCLLIINQTSIKKTIYKNQSFQDHDYWVNFHDGWLGFSCLGDKLVFVYQLLDLNPHVIRQWLQNSQNSSLKNSKSVMYECGSENKSEMSDFSDGRIINTHWQSAKWNDKIKQVETNSASQVQSNFIERYGKRKDANFQMIHKKLDFEIKQDQMSQHKSQVMIDQQQEKNNKEQEISLILTVQKVEASKHTHNITSIQQKSIAVKLFDGEALKQLSEEEQMKDAINQDSVEISQKQNDIKIQSQQPQMQNHQIQKNQDQTCNRKQIIQEMIEQKDIEEAKQAQQQISIKQQIKQYQSKELQQVYKIISNQPQKQQSVKSTQNSKLIVAQQIIEEPNLIQPIRSIKIQQQIDNSNLATVDDLRKQGQYKQNSSILSNHIHTESNKQCMADQVIVQKEKQSPEKIQNIYEPVVVINLHPFQTFIEQDSQMNVEESNLFLHSLHEEELVHDQSIKNQNQQAKMEEIAINNQNQLRMHETLIKDQNQQNQKHKWDVSSNILHSYCKLEGESHSYQQICQLSANTLIVLNQTGKLFHYTKKEHQYKSQQLQLLSQDSNQRLISVRMFYSQLYADQILYLQANHKALFSFCFTTMRNHLILANIQHIQQIIDIKRINQNQFIIATPANIRTVTVNSHTTQITVIKRFENQLSVLEVCDIYKNYIVVGLSNGIVKIYDLNKPTKRSVNNFNLKKLTEQHYIFDDYKFTQMRVLKNGSIFCTYNNTAFLIDGQDSGSVYLKNLKQKYRSNVLQFKINAKIIQAIDSIYPGQEDATFDIDTNIKKIVALYKGLQFEFDVNSQKMIDWKRIELQQQGTNIRYLRYNRFKTNNQLICLKKKSEQQLQISAL